MRFAAITRVLDRLQPIALLAMRVVLGTIMVAHGYPKVFGGMQRFVQTVANLGLPGWWAYLSAGTEFFGGILVIAGVATRFLGLAMLLDMAIAIWKVHWKNGLTGRGGYEFPLAVAAIAFALIFLGAGPFALDTLIQRGAGGARKPAAK